MLFAETLAQAISAHLEVSSALALASQVNPSLRLRRAIMEIRGHFRAGYALASSARKTGVRLLPGLLSAFESGETHGCLAEELAAFARSLHPDPRRALCQAMRRSAEAERFAAALARLLRDRRLTLDVVESAGRVAAAGNQHFRKVVEQVLDDLESGYGLAEALQRCPRYFDPFYCKLLEAAASREHLRLCLERLGREDRA